MKDKPYDENWKSKLPLIGNKFQSLGKHIIVWRFDLFIKSCIIEVGRYCISQNLTFKVMLIIDNAPEHLPESLNFDPRVKFSLPQNTTFLLQHIDQGLIKTCTAYYLRFSFFNLNVVMIEVIEIKANDF